MSLSINETTAINDAIALFDGVIIAAAGNSGSSSVGYPARLNNPKIVSVGSIDSDNARSSFSWLFKKFYGFMVFISLVLWLKVLWSILKSFMVDFKKFYGLK